MRRRRPRQRDARHPAYLSAQQFPAAQQAACPLLRAMCLVRADFGGARSHRSASWSAPGQIVSFIPTRLRSCPDRHHPNRAARRVPPLDIILCPVGRADPWRQCRAAKDLSRSWRGGAWKPSGRPTCRAPLASRPDHHFLPCSSRALADGLKTLAGERAFRRYLAPSTTS